MLDAKTILKDIPDKRQDKDTTSLKFKEQLINFFGDEWKDKTCLEIGTNKGYTTRVLSFLFKKVITCENNLELFQFAMNINQDRDNIEFQQKDVYNTQWDFEDVDVVFIDCIHEYPAVMMDINNSCRLTKPNESMILVFDDYGLPKPPGRLKDVKDAVDDVVKQEERFEVVKFIGEPKGSDCRPGKILKDHEGVICKFTNTQLSIFQRIVDNQLHNIENKLHLGFEESEGLRIPDEYLNEGNFTILRTASGIGDWGIISAMPKLLKNKYPECKVNVPSKKLLKTIFGKDHNNVETIFRNNPYVDEFVDSVDGEIFHDHYRVYDKDNTDIPLIKQILKFWQFEEEEMKDCQPEMYWSPEEETLGNAIIKDRTSGKDFGCLLMSDRFGTQYGKHHEDTFVKDKKVMVDVLKKNPLPYFYYTHKPLNDTPFDFIDKALDLRNIDLRIQLYIKSKAKLNISNQCGTSHLSVRYSECYESQRQYPISHNFVEGIKYI